MRLATLRVSADLRPAVVLGDRVLDLVAARARSGHARLLPGSLREILAAGEAGRELLDRVVEAASRRPDDFADAMRPAAEARFAAPLPEPRLVLSVGANYHAHLREMDTAPPETPMAFHKSVSSVIGPGETILLPRAAPDMVDWEGELTVVMGKPCHEVSEADALDHVAGYTIVNDVSARNWVKGAFRAEGMMGVIVAWEHNILGKLFPTFCPMGPVIVTADEIPDPHALDIKTRLNGEVMQDSNTSDLVFDVRRIISYYSKFLTFQPGDVITTGSPSGVGFGRKPQVFMKAGDVIEVEIDRIGVLRNPVAAA
ncbi:MAG TPA: fumarylacetoacetate hydrolase family protein [Beijerinckiaceae bacterium]